MTVSATDLVDGIKRTLDTSGIPHEQLITELRQVDAAKDRAGGRTFSLNDHVEGLVFALLSNQRPWKRIADNHDNLNRVFLGFEAVKLKAADPLDILDGVRKLQCGNRSARTQMLGLRANIETLERIQHEFGSLDAFVSSDEPMAIAKYLWRPGKYKLVMVGNALALEYLKNVGIPSIKPDVHIKRIMGEGRLGYVAESATDDEMCAAALRLAREANVHLTYLDNLLWIFCADSYGEICGAIPKCGECELSRKGCRAPGLQGTAALDTGANDGLRSNPRNLRGHCGPRQ